MTATVSLVRALLDAASGPGDGRTHGHHQFRRRLFADLVPGRAPGDWIDGEQLALTVSCGAQEAEQQVAAIEADADVGTLGLEVSELSAAVAERLGVKNSDGVVIASVKSGSLAERVGLRSGDVIVEVNRKRIRDVEDFRKAIDAANLEDGVLLLTRSAAGSRFVVLKSNAS